MGTNLVGNLTREGLHNIRQEASPPEEAAALPMATSRDLAREDGLPRPATLRTLVTSAGCVSPRGGSPGGVAPTAGVVGPRSRGNSFSSWKKVVPVEDDGCGGVPHWTSVGDFVNRSKIGSGKTSVVYSARCPVTNLPVAIKVYKRSAMTEANKNQVRREIETLKRIRHPHIYSLYTVFEDSKTITLILEYCRGGDVFQLLAKCGGVMKEEKVVREILYPLLRALQYLHGLHIMHRDIKPENLFRTTDGVVKLGDFGFAICTDTEMPKSRLGTLDYMAPEVLRMPGTHEGVDADGPSPPITPPGSPGRGYDEKVDIWACGILAYELLLGKPPFEVPSKRQTCELILTREVPYGAGWPSYLSKESTRFMEAALCKAPSKRPSADELLSHPWILKYAPAPSLKLYLRPGQVTSPSSVLDLTKLTLDISSAPTSPGPATAPTVLSHPEHKLSPSASPSAVSHKKATWSIPRHLAGLVLSAFKGTLSPASACCTPRASGSGNSSDPNEGLVDAAPVAEEQQAVAPLHGDEAGRVENEGHEGLGHFLSRVLFGD